MSNNQSSGLGSYYIKLLQGNNWLPWKQRMLAILRDQDLKKYVEKDTVILVAAIPSAPTEAKTEAIAKWKKVDSKTHTRIELSLKNLEMIHLSGAITAKDMWKQLSMVKESKGCLGVLATQKALYWTMAPEGFDMIEHISKLRSYQDDLHIMENLITNKDFVTILIT